MSIGQAQGQTESRKLANLLSDSDSLRFDPKDSEGKLIRFVVPGAERRISGTNKGREEILSTIDTSTGSRELMLRLPPIQEYSSINKIEKEVDSLIREFLGQIGAEGDKNTPNGVAVDADIKTQKNPEALVDAIEKISNKYKNELT